MNQNIKWILVFCMAVLLTGCLGKDRYVSYGGLQNTENSTVDTSVTDTSFEEPDGLISVYVCGRVKNPGVYQLEPDARICDALESAGGIEDDGVGEALNQAEHVKDGQTVYVPSEQELVEQTVKSTEDGLVDINTAEKGELLSLPGIGEAKAESILSYREEHGPFDKIEELMNIPGIKEGVFEKMRPYIKVR